MICISSYDKQPLQRRYGLSFNHFKGPSFFSLLNYITVALIRDRTGDTSRQYIKIFKPLYIEFNFILGVKVYTLDREGRVNYWRDVCNDFA
jgi:hypothetical protein